MELETNALGGSRSETRSRRGEAMTMISQDEIVSNAKSVTKGLEALRQEHQVKHMLSAHNSILP